MNITKAFCSFTALVIVSLTNLSFADSAINLQNETDGLEILNLEDLFDPNETTVEEEIGTPQPQLSDELPGVPPGAAFEPGTNEQNSAPETAVPVTPVQPGVRREKKETVALDIVEVSERFFRLTPDAQNNGYQRTATSEAKPGDLIELVITAVNTSPVTVNDVEMVNSVPKGPVSFLRNSIAIDEGKSLYRLSRNGTDFFPADAPLQASSIGYIQWLIFSLAPNERTEMRYRIKVQDHQ